MRIAVDSVNAGSTATAGNDISYTHTCAGTERMLIVGVTHNGSMTGAVVRYAGTGLAKISESTSGGNTSSLWYLANPALGENTVLVDLAGANGPWAAGSISFIGADPTIGAVDDASGSSANPSNVLTTTSSGNGYAVDCIWGGGANFTVGAGQTQIFNHSAYGGASRDGAGSYEGFTGGGNPTMSWTMAEDSWAWCALEVVEHPIVDYPLTAVYGAFTLTGQDTLFKKATTLIAEFGSFVLTGIDATFTLLVAIWSNQSKNSSSFSTQSKNSSSFSTQTKNSSTFTNLGRAGASVYGAAIYGVSVYGGATTTYSNESKNSTSYTNQTKT